MTAARPNATMRETYFHRLSRVPRGARAIDVTRRPPWWLPREQRERLERCPELAPSSALLEAFLSAKEAHRAAGMPDRDAHNRAFAELGYRTRFREQIANDGEAMATLEALVPGDGDGSVVLVCYCGPGKRCHRFLLLELAASRFGAIVAHDTPESPPPGR